MTTPIDRLESKYESSDAHLRAIVNALMEQFSISEENRHHVNKAVREAFLVGHRTTTTDDWCDVW